MYVFIHENKKCLIPTLQFDSNKKAKVDNLTPNSVSEDIDYFLQEENLTSDLIFKRDNFIPVLKSLSEK